MRLRIRTFYTYFDCIFDLRKKLINIMDPSTPQTPIQTQNDVQTNKNNITNVEVVTPPITVVYDSDPDEYDDMKEMMGW